MSNNTLEEILNLVDYTFDKIQQDKQDPQRLLGHANTLSTLMYNVAPLYVSAREESIRAEAQYKDKVDDSFMKYKRNVEKYTVDEAMSLAKKEHRELRDEWITNRTLEHKLGLLREDISRKVSLLQSYAAELRAEKYSRPKD